VSTHAFSELANAAEIILDIILFPKTVSGYFCTLHKVQLPNYYGTFTPMATPVIHGRQYGELSSSLYLMQSTQTWTSGGQ
jgi:hypothetical protein